MMRAVQSGRVYSFQSSVSQAGLRRYDTAFSGSIKKIQLRSVPPAGRGGRYQFDDAAKACIPMGTARR
jgi:hypothetical protein